MSNRRLQNLFVAFQPQLAASKQPLKNRKAIHAITHCRTREMGVSVYRCQHQHAPIEQFHSCRHRSCYLCAQKKRLEWIEKQKERLLDVPHFHVIFTLPHEYLSLWRYNEKLFGQLLFKASQQTLLELIGDARYGGVTPGIMMALHTWGRKLTLHLHTHCLVSAGGLDHSNEWHDLGKFLLPSAVIRKVYRGKLQSFIKAALASGDLVLPPDMTRDNFWSQYRKLYRKDWCVRIEPRYEHGKGVVLYLARYCKGGPVDPRQLTAIRHDRITMSYLDHRDHRIKRQQLKPMAFIQRLLQHVTPIGMHTVRYYGLYAAASKDRHRQCREMHGTLAGVSAGLGARITSMLLYCKSCGGPARLAYQLWPSGRKAISINKEAPGVRAGGYVQQDDETHIANPLRTRDPCR